MYQAEISGPGGRDVVRRRRDHLRRRWRPLARSGAPDPILGRLSESFTDHRDPDRIEHSVEALIKQRVLGLCLGYEDLNDHDELCRDRLLALLCDRDDLTGEFRRVESDRGKPLAGKSTLNRLELTPVEGPKPEYKKIVALLVEVFLEAYAKAPEELILDLMIRCMGSRKGDSSTATTNATATCPCTSSVASICCVRDSGRRIEGPPTGWCRN